MHRQSETNRKCGGSLLCGFSEFHLSAENCKRFFPELSLGLRLRKVPGLQNELVQLSERQLAGFPLSRGQQNAV